MATYAVYAIQKVYWRFDVELTDEELQKFSVDHVVKHEDFFPAEYEAVEVLHETGDEDGMEVRRIMPIADAVANDKTTHWKDPWA